ncbi:hypothetical protein Xaut_2311 [Xanthobacter versatilis]|uniref:Uncharacterized protein n=1 Tax=Xanthobacter autotrophicus (strain ATCC BAA-1158 / Py2) TaxID=78245 RepID=A7IHR1_XANP2|nr:hypothetical protein Xaut_2311 [Xanthobacter autotrophicus Py2]
MVVLSAGGWLHPASHGPVQPRLPNCGVVGYRAEQIATAGRVAFGFVNALASIALTGGVTPVFGTNPIAIDSGPPPACARRVPAWRFRWPSNKLEAPAPWPWGRPQARPAGLCEERRGGHSPAIDGGCVSRGHALYGAVAGPIPIRMHCLGG